MDPSKPSPEVLTAYFSFVVAFCTAPVQVAKRYSAKHGIDSKLVTFAVVGAAVAYLITLTPRAAQGVPSETAAGWSIPAALSLLVPSAVFVSCVAMHGIMKLPEKFQWLNTPPMPGSLWDSLNGGFAFTAFYLPFSATVWVIAESVPALQGPAGLTLIFAGIGYLTAALAGTHPGVSYGTAFSSVVAGLIWVRFAALLVTGP